LSGGQEQGYKYKEQDWSGRKEWVLKTQGRFGTIKERGDNGGKKGDLPRKINLAQGGKFEKKGSGQNRSEYHLPS